MGKMWLGAGAGVLSDLVQSYRREISRTDRLATLRTRKRRGEEVEAAHTTGRKQVKESQALKAFTGVLEQGSC